MKTEKPPIVWQWWLLDDAGEPKAATEEEYDAEILRWAEAGSIDASTEQGNRAKRWIERTTVAGVLVQTVFASRDTIEGIHERLWSTAYLHPDGTIEEYEDVETRSEAIESHERAVEDFKRRLLESPERAKSPAAS